LEKILHVYHIHSIIHQSISIFSLLVAFPYRLFCVVKDRDLCLSAVDSVNTVRTTHNKTFWVDMSNKKHIQRKILNAMKVLRANFAPKTLAANQSRDVHAGHRKTFSVHRKSNSWLTMVLRWRGRSARAELRYKHRITFTKRFRRYFLQQNKTKPSIHILLLTSTEHHTQSCLQQYFARDIVHNDAIMSKLRK